MGARQSYLYIFLKSKENEYGETGYRVTRSRSVANGWIDFEVVTHSIKYNVTDPRYFDIYLYETEKTISKVSYLFAYCSPSVDTHVVNNIHVYYSVLRPDKPLVISFDRGGHTYSCEIDELRDAGWDWAYKITKYTFSGNLLAKLKEQYTKLFWDLTIGFDVPSKKTTNVKGYEEELGDKKNFRIVFLPSGGDSVLGSDCIFSFDYVNHLPICSGAHRSSGIVENPVDPYYLQTVKGQFYDGIMIYFARDQDKPDEKPFNEYDNGMVLLLEFIDYRNSTVLIKRKDKKGYWWSHEKISFNNDASLLKALVEIKNNADKIELNTILLDTTKSYKGVEVSAEENKNAYNKYTHSFNEPKEPNLIFDRKTIKIDSLDLSKMTVKNVDVYYLKADGKVDKKPFLIVFDEDGTSQEKKKGYHFNNNEDFDKWVEFTFIKDGKPLSGKQLQDKLEEKIKKIEEYGCTRELYLFKPLAHQILMLKDEQPPPVIPEDEKEKRPKVLDEIPLPPEDKSLLIIIGGSVGGGLFVISSAVGYGIYWYNTTIKLLT